MTPVLVELSAGDDSITIDDAAGQPVTLHRTAKRRVRSFRGPAAISSPRASVRSRPTAHGAINETHWTGGGLWVLDALVIGNDEADAIRELRAINKPLLESLQAPALLKWTEQGTDGLALQATVKLASDVDPEPISGPTIWRYQAQLLAEDPRVYSQALTTATGGTLGTSGGGDTYPATYPNTYAESVGGTVAVDNTGNRPTPPVFRLYGGCTDAQILLVDSGKKIALTGNVAPGDYLELDVQARTIKLNGSSSVLHYLDPATSTWFELPAGTSTIRVVALAFDATARCDVIYRSAYA